MKKTLIFAATVVATVYTIRCVEVANKVVHDPLVIAAYRDAMHNTRVTFNRSYRKHYVENLIEDIQKEG